MKLTPKDLRKITVGFFLAVPFLSSLISTLHIITFFGLGNATWMAVVLAIAFEIGSIASLMTLTVLDRINKMAVWFIFVVLIAMQMIGNVYYTYDYVSVAVLSNPQWITSFVELVEMVTMQKMEPRTTKFVLSLLIGLPIPVVSLAFLKSVADYLRGDSQTAFDANTIPGKPIDYKNDIEVIEDNSEIIESPDDSTHINEVIGKEDADTESKSNIDLVTISDDVNDVISIEDLIQKPLGISINENPTLASDDDGNLDDQDISDNKEEISSDIYEEESPEDSFFDDDTENEEYDGFSEPGDDNSEKKRVF